MSAIERAEPHAFVVGQVRRNTAPELPMGDGVDPECPAALLEPGVVGGEGARAGLEGDAHRRDVRGVRRVPSEFDEVGYRFERSHRRDAGVPFTNVSRTENRVFFPQAALDQAIGDGTVDLKDGVLTIVAQGRRFALSEAVRVTGEVSGAGDAHEIVGRAKVQGYLEQLGAEILETSMLLGDAAYDVEPGWMGVPIGSFAEHVASDAAKGAREAAARGGAMHPEPTDDEQLLASCFSNNR